MRRWLLRLALAAVVLTVSGYWVLSGFSFTGTHVYDLNDPNPESEQTRNSWRYRLSQRLLPLLYNHDTRYAPGYKEEVFQTLRSPASQDEVHALLGQPLAKRRLADGRWMWHYSEPGPKTQDFVLRILEFGADGRLLKRHAEFYVD